MKTPEDPRQVLEALLSADSARLPFPPEAIEAARSLVQGGSTPATSAVEALPELLGLAVLESAVRARSAALAEALAGSAHRGLAKAAKKALYQLRSVGVQVQEKKPAPIPAPAPPAPSHAEELPCLLTPINGAGERALIAVRPQRGGGLEVHQIIFTDEAGVTGVGAGDLNRSGYRKQLKEIRAARLKPAIEVPLDEAKELLAEAAGVNLRSRTPFPPELEELLRALGMMAREEAPRVPPPEEGDARLAVEGHRLHEELEIAAWMPPEAELRRLALRMDEVMASPLQLSDQQRGDQLMQAFRSAAEAFFTPEMKRLYGGRLWKMADYFARTGRPQAAELARAEARRLFHDAPGLFTRFGEFLFEKVFHLSQRGRGGQPPPAPGEPLPRAPAVRSGGEEVPRRVDPPVKTHPMPLRAAVFDMDGTLVDNMRYHSEAWVFVSRRLGILHVTSETFEREFAGKKNEEIFPLLLGRTVPGEELEALAHEKETLYRSLYAKRLEAMPGAVAMLERMRGAGVRLAVATAAPPENRTLVLDGLELRSLFEHVVGAEDVTRGKPAPDIYLKAARMLGVAPGECVAFEDAINGVRSAVAAGMAAVGVTTTTPAELLHQAGAEWTIQDFNALPDALSHRLFGAPP